MKRFQKCVLFLFGLLMLSWKLEAQTITINGTSYDISVTESIPLTPEATYTRYDIAASGFAQKFSVLKIDTRAENLKTEAWSALDYTYAGKENPRAMSVRKSVTDHEVLAAINGDFFGDLPCGAEMVLGELTQKVNSIEFCLTGDDCAPHIGIDVNNQPIIDVMRFNPYVKRPDGEIYTITALNNTRWENNLILFNGYLNGTQTTTNEWGMEFMVSPVDGAWIPDVNGDIRCTVEKIRPIYNSYEPATSATNVAALEKMDIVKGKAILSAHGTARVFLTGIEQGDELYLNWGVALENNPQVKALTEVIGGGTICLKNKVVQPYVATDSDREKLRHPRTAVGYTNDRVFLFFVTVDGRQTGMTGVTTRELADIMLFAGADNALNLDGGGSTCIVVNGTVKNNPSDGSPRSVTNGLLLAKVPLKTSLEFPGELLVNTDVQVYPNPADEILFFRINPKQTIHTLRIDIYDSGGKKIKEVCREKNLNRGMVYTYTCESGMLKSGAYLYEVNRDGKRTSGKLIIK